MNLLRNPGFETEPNAPGWLRANFAVFVNLQVYAIADRAPAGSWFLETNTSRQAGSIALDVSQAPVPGGNYQFSIWLRSPSGRPYSACPTIWAFGTPNTAGHVRHRRRGMAAADPHPRHPSPAARPQGYSKLRAEVYENTLGLKLELDDASLVLTNANRRLTARRAAPPRPRRNGRHSHTARARPLDGARGRAGASHAGRVDVAAPNDQSFRDRAL